MNPIWRNAMMASGALWHAPLTNLVAVYQPIGAASLAASYVNLVNPGTYDAAPGAAPTWSAATGWIFNGTTQYLTTGVVPSTTHTVIIRFSGALADSGVIGAVDINPTRRFDILPIYQSNGVLYGFGTDGPKRIPKLAAGVLAIAGGQPYRNGAPDGAPIPASTMPSFGFAIGARARASGADFYFGGNVQAVAICSTVQTPAQIAAASAAMAAL